MLIPMEGISVTRIFNSFLIDIQSKPYAKHMLETKGPKISLQSYHSSLAHTNPEGVTSSDFIDH